MIVIDIMLYYVYRAFVRDSYSSMFIDTMADDSRNNIDITSGELAGMRSWSLLASDARSRGGCRYDLRSVLESRESLIIYNSCRYYCR